jgi:hypothetical protein
MKIMIESTCRMVTICQGREEIPARVWEGETEGGVKVVCLITRIGAHKDQDLAQFQAELEETAVPSAEGEGVFPLRLIL